MVQGLCRRVLEQERRLLCALKHYEGHNDLHYERNVHNDLWGFLMQQHYELPNAAITRSFLMQTLGAS